METNEGFVFGLDIGTRSIVGTVGYRIGTDRFIVVAQESIEHTSRAVIDGQIHDIATVSKTITEIKNRLENRIKCELTEVSIAAAGRVLKTIKVHTVEEFPNEVKVTEDHIRALDMKAVDEAYEEIRKDPDNEKKNFYCVGFSAIKYYLNSYPMEMITMHTANNIGVDLIATFLPEEVVDGLYESVELAGLHVASLTLEPIAAIQIAIPEKFRLLNIALVDIGAGTSDISIVKEGSITAFGMIPLAGDEITEAIAQEYLLDFETAEAAKRQCDRKKTISFKNIFNENIRVTKEEIEEVTENVIDDIAYQIAQRILELNGGKVSAVFVVGGGGKHKDLPEKLADHLGLPENRVALRGAEVLSRVKFEQDDIVKDSSLVTPIGICLNFYEQKNNFIHVFVNDQNVKLYDNGKATVLDACISSGFSQNNLFPIRGETITYTLNGEERSQKGKIGEVAIVKKNDKEVSLNEFVQENDIINIKPSTKGEDGSISLAEIDECKDEIKIKLFGKDYFCPKSVEVNGKKEEKSYKLKDGDKVEIIDYYSVKGILDFVGVEYDNDMVILNGRDAGLAAMVHDGDEIEDKPKPIEVKKEEEEKEDSFEEQMKKDPLLQPLKPLPDWAKDIPFDTAKLGNDGKIIQGNPAKNADDIRPIHVVVNGQTVTMPLKEKPIFVDVFDVFPFDLSLAKGKKLITKINGEEKDFTQQLFEGDKIELVWE